MPRMATKDTAQTIPLAREELDIAKRTTETGSVRVRTLVHEREEVIETPLLHEEIEVRRLPLEQVLDAPVSPRQEGDVLIVPVVEERAVVRKCLVLVEEIHIRRRRIERTHTEHVALRSEEALVERNRAPEPNTHPERK